MFVAKPVATSLFTLITLSYLLEGHVAGAQYRRPDEMTHRRSLRGVDSSANEMDFLLAETASFWGRNLNGSGSGGKGKRGRGKGGGGQVRLVLCQSDSFAVPMCMCCT